MAAALCYGSRGGGAAVAFYHHPDAYDIDGLIGALGQLRCFLGGQKATLRWGGQPVPPQQADARLAAPAAVLAGGGAAARLRTRAQPGRGPMGQLKGVELANLAGDILREVTAAAERGVQRIRGTPHLPFSFLRHCGLSSHGLTDPVSNFSNSDSSGSSGAPWHSSRAGSHCQRLARTVPRVPATHTTMRATTITQAPMNPIAGVTSTSRSTAPTITNARRLNTAAATPTRNAQRHEVKATRAAAARSTTRPGGIVGVFVTPATICRTNPAAAARRATTVRLRDMVLFLLDIDGSWARTAAERFGAGSDLRRQRRCEEST
jgi:hypothetical protein